MPTHVPRAADPFRVLGLPPDASPAEVRRAHRMLAKRHHPDAAGPAATARFLAIQQAYEAIAAAGWRGGRRPATARAGRRDSADDWYAAARDAARGRARGRAGDPGPRGGGAAPPGGGPGQAPGARSGPGCGPAHDRGAGGTQADAAAPRTATFGSTTYDDAVVGEPEWHGSAWYGAASGTYWTVNPREYADPRKHGPEYLARAAAAARDATPRSAGRRTGAAATEGAPGARSERGPSGGSTAGARATGRGAAGTIPSPAATIAARLRRLLRSDRPRPPA